MVVVLETLSVLFSAVGVTMLSVTSLCFGVSSIRVNMGKDGDAGGTLCVDCETWAKTARNLTPVQISLRKCT